MSSQPIPIPQDATVGDAQTPQSVPVPDDAQIQNEGEIVNDVGNKVIVPKEGESFQDTMKRAVEYHKSLTPEQQDDAINKETATAPKKVAETLGAAAGAGIAGPAILAAAGEGIDGIAKLFKPSMKLGPVKDAIGEIARDAKGRMIPWVEQAGPSLAKQGGRAVVQFVTQHPIATAFAYHVAREIGIPLPKVLDALSKVTGD